MIPIIHEKNKSKAILLGYFLFCLMYLLAGHFHFFPVKRIEMGVIDTFVPFIPGSIWIYDSQFILLFLALWLPNDSIRRSIIYYAMLASIGVACAIFILLPTDLPHQSINFDGINARLWHLLYFTDPSCNCFPSLHAALATIAAISLIYTNPYWRWLAPSWALLILISTLTTKQHYLIDVVGGVVLGLISLIMVRYFVMAERIYERS